LVKNSVFAELLKHASWANEEVNFYHFRDVARHELDLVIERSEGEVLGIEVKASRSAKPEAFSGLSSFANYANDRFLQGFLFAAPPNHQQNLRQRPRHARSPQPKKCKSPLL
jgi:hypothetical protein